ncbi:hypothetical protein Bbelb_320590 [Branchiostoma belcheri]|nr:hypothetical protein Bbelb_320590 [Branchiostoma belcheri]
MKRGDPGSIPGRTRDMSGHAPDVVSLGKALYTTFLTPPRCEWVPNFDLSHGAGVNIALGKTAVQSSYIDDIPGNARLAVDGNIASNHHHGSCTHTKHWPGEENASWWVDLGQPYTIGRVRIFNRMDCCQERLNPFNIHIGDSAQVSENPRCGGHGDHVIDEKRPSILVSCQGMKGRYVGVRLPGYRRIVSLCEVQVFPIAWNMRNGGYQDGYIRVGWPCIKLASSLKSFWDAQLSCVEEGATLAMPRTEEFDHALRRLVHTSGGNFQHWIGLNVTCNTGVSIPEFTYVDGKDWHWGYGYRGFPVGFTYPPIKDTLCLHYWLHPGHTIDPMWSFAGCTEKKRYICQSSPA